MKILACIVAFICTGTIASETCAQLVTLDYYFNHEFRKTKDRKTERFHYTWEDTTNSGYSVWGDIFIKNGMQINSLETAPAFDDLNSPAIYIIVDPDNKKETANPAFIQSKDIEAIRIWVEKGGVLVLLANDSANVELEHFNNLAQVFGIHFNNDKRNLVDGENFEMGALHIPPGHPVFKTARKIYLKEICSLSLSGPAKALLSDKGHVIIAVSEYGRGTVLAIGDPFIYNEYCNGRLPASFDNDKAAGDLVKWLKKRTGK